MRRIPHQLRRKPIPRTVQHAKRLPKHQITHDIKHQPFTPMRRIPVAIPRLSPVLLINCILISAAAAPKQLTPHTHVRQNILLQIANRIIRESRAHHPPLARMLHLINRTVHTDCRRGRRKRLVKVRFLDIAPEAVYRLEPGRRVDGQQIRTQPDIWAVLLVSVVECEMSRSAVGVVCEPDIRDFGKEGAGVVRERV